MRKIKMDTVQDGKLAQDFGGLASDDIESRKQLKMIPILFLHGLSGSRTSQSGSCRDLASHGYCVFSIDHHDGSAHYSRKENGDEVYWDLKQGLTDFALRVKQLKIREDEVQDCLNEMFQPNFLQEKLDFNPNVQLDLDKLIAGGHSFGGLSAMLAARKDKRVKALFTFDPWVWACH